MGYSLHDINGQMECYKFTAGWIKTQTQQKTVYLLVLWMIRCQDSLHSVFIHRKETFSYLRRLFYCIMPLCNAIGKKYNHESQRSLWADFRMPLPAYLLTVSREAVLRKTTWKNFFSMGILKQRGLPEYWLTSSR